MVTNKDDLRSVRIVLLIPDSAVGSTAQEPDQETS